MTSTWTNGLEDDATVPPNWFTDDNGDHFCLVCRRERAVEIALAAADELGTEARAKLRSTTVVEFEIERDPERPEGEIARAARTSIGAVRKARKRLEDSGGG
ncbi:MAG: hypothetical protein ACRDL1_10285 [Solirubrobacterales bacterium]